MHCTEKGFTSRWSALAVVSIVLVLATANGYGQTPVAATRADLDFFEAKVRPLLVNKCYSCHSTAAKKSKGGLKLDSRSAILTGGDSGTAAKPGDPDQSLVIHAIRYKDSDLAMPPQGKLADAEIAVLAEWVRRGVPFPETTAAAEAKSTLNLDAGRKFWSFQPVKQISLPVVKDAKWVQRPIDAFLLAEMEKRGLTPSSPAEPRVLLRRLYFDLIGLPPTPVEVDTFVRDMASGADRQKIVGKVVDRLLASQHHGERWGRYWLDLARYCDIGEPWMESKARPHLYRDWVVKAINEDMPYDQFVIQQLASDLLPGAKLEDRAALGFIGLSPSYWKELKLAPDVIKTVVAEEWEERIHSVCSTFLGLTVACARCHDHKFDPITAQDYYGLAGVFASTRPADRAVGDFRFLIADLRLPATLGFGAFDVAAWAFQSKIETQKSKILLAPAVEEAALHVLADGPHKTKLVYKPAEAIDVAMQVRGNPANLGPIVPRRFLTVLSVNEPRRLAHGSGRLDLAKAIVTDAAPLTARVIVNRVWKLHFGAGLVETPSDFGAQGERPSHPALLDDLTARFIANGWSLKWLHREIVLSAAYQQTSDVSKASETLDADNRLLSRMNRTRLDVEAWRDAMLFVTGTLDQRLGGPAQELAEASNRRRTIYGLIKRRELSDLLRLHDFPDPTTHGAGRVPTTTPLQLLFTLNGPLVQQQAAALVKRVHAEAKDTDDRIRHAYRLLYGRPATDGQLGLGKAFLTLPSESQWQQYAQALLGSNEFLFVD